MKEPLSSRTTAVPSVVRIKHISHCCYAIYHEYLPRMTLILVIAIQASRQEQGPKSRGHVYQDF